MLMRISEELRELLDPACKYPSCGCAMVNDVMRPLSAATAVLSVHGRQDLVVEGMAQVREGETVVVDTSHVGLVYNAEVYRALARFLAGGTA
jgi:hypothetical protein